MGKQHTFAASRFFRWKESGFTPSFYLLTEDRHVLTRAIYQGPRATLARFWTTWQPAQPGWIPVKSPPSLGHSVGEWGFYGLARGCEGQYHLHNGQDAPLYMLQVALALGFSQFVLLGCDDTREGHVYDLSEHRTWRGPGANDHWWRKAVRDIPGIVDCTDEGRLWKSGITPHQPLQAVL